MDKSKKIKILSAVSIIGAILAITVAFALITRSMVINGSGNVKPALWDIHFKDISEPTITGGASVITAPTVADKGAKIDNLEVRLTLPQDKIEYTVYIENSGDMNAKIDDIKYPTLNEEESKIFKFSAKYEKDGSPMQVGDTLFKNEVKKVIITIEYLDISDKNLLPKETKTINIDFKIKYVQDNNSYADEGDQSLLPDGYKECEYIESTGTQYINTNYYPKIDTKLEMDLSFNGTFKTIGSTFISSYNSSVSNDTFTVNFGEAGGQNGTIFFWLKKTYASGAQIKQIQGLNTIIKNRNTLVLDRKTGLVTYGTSTLQAEAATGDVNDTLKVFASYALTPFQAYNMRLYSLKIYTGDSLDRDLIPCLDDNDIPCMYDRVSGNTFYNQGTGEFNYQLK